LKLGVSVQFGMRMMPVITQFYAQLQRKQLRHVANATITTTATGKCNNHTLATASRYLLEGNR